MIRKSFAYPLFSFIILIGATWFFCPNNSGVKVDTQKTVATKSSVTLETFDVGDVIQVGSHTIVLNGANVEGNLLSAIFTIDNQGAEEFLVSSLLLFEARDGDGGKLEQDFFTCGISLDGAVLPGDKMKGRICWSGLTTDKAQIYYRSNLFGSGSVVWKVQTSEDTITVAPRPTATETATAAPRPTATDAAIAAPSLEDNIARVEAEINAALVDNDLAIIESINPWRRSTGRLEIELFTTFDSGDKQPVVSWLVVYIFAKTLTNQEPYARLLVTDSEEPTFVLTTYSKSGDYRYQSETDYETLVNIANGTVLYDEWITASNAGFR